MGKDDARRDVTRVGAPFQPPFRRVAINLAGRDVVAGVGHEDFVGVGVDGDPVRILEPFFRSVGDKVAGDDPALLDIDDGVADIAGLGEVVPGVAIHIERVAAEGHIGTGEQIHLIDDAICFRVDDEDHRLYVIVVAAAGDPEVAVGVEFHAVKVGGHVNLGEFLEGIQVDDRNGMVVIGHAIAAGVGHIEFVADDDHLFRLIAHDAGVLHLKGRRVDPGDIAEPVVGIRFYGARIRTDIGVAVLEGDVPAVRNRYLADVPGGRRIHHFHEIRAVDYHPQLAAVDGQVVAHVAQFLDDTGVALGIDILDIDAGGVVVIVQRAFVAAHIAFVEQEESGDVAGLRRGNDVFGFPAAGKQQGRHQNTGQISDRFHRLYIFHDKINRKFVPGIG